MKINFAFAASLLQFKLKNQGRYALVLAAMAFSTMHLSANPTGYTGEDLGVLGTGAHPNSDTAYSNFYADASSIGSVSLINFEGSSLGAFSSLTAASGVTVTGSDYFGNDQTVRDTTGFPAGPTLDGSNTTPGGANFIEENGGTVTFTFADPINSFGAWLTGVQDFAEDIVSFSDGSSWYLVVPEGGTSCCEGAVDFVGITDAGKSISSITIFTGNTGYDSIGVDDVSYGSPVSTTPEPGSVVLMLTGCLAFGLLLWQRRSAKLL